MKREAKDVVRAVWGHLWRNSVLPVNSFWGQGESGSFPHFENMKRKGRQHY